MAEVDAKTGKGKILYRVLQGETGVPEIAIAVGPGGEARAGLVGCVVATKWVRKGLHVAATGWFSC